MFVDRDLLAGSRLCAARQTFWAGLEPRAAFANGVPGRGRKLGSEVDVIVARPERGCVGRARSCFASPTDVDAGRQPAARWRWRSRSTADVAGSGMAWAYGRRHVDERVRRSRRFGSPARIAASASARRLTARAPFSGLAGREAIADARVHRRHVGRSASTVQPLAIRQAPRARSRPATCRRAAVRGSDRVGRGARRVCCCTAVGAATPRDLVAQAACRRRSGRWRWKPPLSLVLIAPRVRGRALLHPAGDPGRVRDQPGA